MAREGAEILKPKIVIAVNTAWNLFNFRAGLIRSMVDSGYEVVAVAPHDQYSDRLIELGCRFVSLPMDNNGTHPGRDLLLLWRFLRLFRLERPVVYLGYTVKPNVYGSLAARFLGIHVINNISGLGAVFIKDGWLTRLVRGMYRTALSRSVRVFFQNNDDRQMFIAHRLVRESVTDLLPGSGIDLNKFSPVPLPNRSPIRFLLIARMLFDKGVREYVEAARLLKQRGVKAEFCLLGFLDVKNPAAVSRADMDRWVAEGVVRYLGATDTIRQEISQADCVVLPSYREGTPRTLLEAAAMARPIVTTNAVGCREVVDDGVNGFLCRVKDVDDLAEKLGRMAALSREERQAMGMRGREKIVHGFDEQIVINKYLEILDEITERRGRMNTLVSAALSTSILEDREETRPCSRMDSAHAVTNVLTRARAKAKARS